MGRIARTVFLLVLVLGAGYLWRDQVRTFALQAYREIAPCSVPITYRIGSVDPQFGISTSTLIRAMEDAADIWRTGIDRTLFSYDQQTGTLVVNLAYDTRQATTQKLAVLGLSVEEDLETYEATREKYLALRSQYLEKRDTFESAYAAYEADARAYDSEVKKRNARGGAPQTVYDELDQKQRELEARGNRLETMQGEVNTLASDVNAMVAQLNHLAATLNISVDAYNKVGAGTEEEFEEAVYERRPGSQTITVFEYDSEARLVRVIAHEFGHALGLEHVEEPAAIMYRLNRSKNQVLSDVDREALATLCVPS